MKRHTVVALLALGLAALPAAAAVSPAHAATYCQYFAGPTPSVEVDLEDDGNPEVRVPSLRDVSVCAKADVFVHGNPVRVEQCRERDPNCWRVLVHLQAGATIDEGITMCHTVDGHRLCGYYDPPPRTVMTPDVPTMCVGVDLTGGYPCSGGTALIGFE